MLSARPILLEDIWKPSEPQDYKVHFARWNQSHQPLDAWVRSRTEWQTWQQYRPTNNDFNRPKILSLMSFYHEPGAWLFGGVYRVRDRLADRYVVELTDELAPFIGRLKLNSPYKERQSRPKLEGVLNQLVLKEVLAEPYTGRHFPGFEEIDISFEELEALVHNGRADWKAPLSSVAGVYLLTDTRTNQRYVGSAWGEGGVWARWTSYVQTGHGGNVALLPLIQTENLDYCRSNFRLTLLEHRPGIVGKDVIEAREAHWKRILFTRLELNRN